MSVSSFVCRIASITTLFIKKEVKGETWEDPRAESVLERVSVPRYGTLPTVNNLSNNKAITEIRTPVKALLVVTLTKTLQITNVMSMVLGMVRTAKETFCFLLMPNTV